MPLTRKLMEDQKAKLDPLRAISARFSGPSAFDVTGVETFSQSCHIQSMAKHPKRPRDPAQLAKLMVDIATGAVSDADIAGKKAPELGRAGGLKGGVARSAALSPERRREIGRIK